MRGFIVVIKKFGGNFRNMHVYGVDYYDPVENEVRFMIVDATDINHARQEAIRELREYGISKRNIRQIEELTYLKR